MPEISTIDFILVEKPIRNLVTKFGGQPIWYSEPEWPISRSLQRPMQFICRIKLEDRLFGETVGQMAYIFMTNPNEEGVNTADPEGGENAVIIQPGSQEVACEPISNGSTLFYREGRHEQKKAWFGVRDEYFDVLIPCEFEVEMTYQDEMDLEEFVRLKEAGDEIDNTTSLLPDDWSRNKIGGSPAFVQADDWPFGSPSPLLLQLHAYGLPFTLEPGGDGAESLFAFISNDGSVGRLLWQCT